jgi:long-chain acyl-CoA synthetase
MTIPATDSVLARFRQIVCRNPRRPVLEFGSARITFAELDEDTDRLACAFTEMGTAPGDRVALLLGNSLRFVQVYLACLKSGVVVVPFNPAAPLGALLDSLHDCQPVAAVVQPRHAEFVEELVARIPSLRRVVVEGTELDSLFHRSVPSSPPEPPPAENLATIIYTSGTTGRPKGVMLSHSNLLQVALAGQDMLQLDENDRVGIIMPLFHLYGLREIDMAIVAGATVVLPQQLTFPAHVLKQMQAGSVTGFSAVPSGLSLMLERYGTQLAACGSRLRYITIGTAPASTTLLTALRSFLPTTRLITTYGLTECSRVCWHEVRDARIDPDTGAAGRPYRGVEVRLQDPVDGRGRVLVRGGMLMRGYWCLPEQTCAAFDADGFLLAPDRGQLTVDGTLHLLGRIDDVINCGGEKISPDEVEEILLTHPHVASAAVIAAPDPAGVLGEVVRAVVVRRSGSSLGVEELIRHAAAALEPHKVPRLIEFVEHLPLTDLGKPRRALLRQGRGD